MPEWSIGPHSKCGERVTVPRVRIPVFPRKQIVEGYLLFLCSTKNISRKLVQGHATEIFFRERAKKRPAKIKILTGQKIVEMQRVELWSKRGNRKLSTCLFLTLVFVRQQDQDHQLPPYPLKFHLDVEAHLNYS